MVTLAVELTTAKRGKRQFAGLYFMNNQKELRIIRGTTIVCFTFGVLGVMFAVMADSKSMLLDGLYSFIQSIFILTSGFVLKLVGKKDDENYQFGYGAFEPFFIAVRTIVLVGMNIVLGFNAIKSLFSGGYRVEANLGMIFTGLSIVGCSIVWCILYRNAKKLSSPMLKAEARSWINDTLLSVAVLLSFFIMWLLDRTGHSNIANYIDPIITILFVISLSFPLLKQLFQSTKELLNAAPPEEIQDNLDAIIEKYVKQYDFRSYMIYSNKQGRVVYSTIHIFLKNEMPVSTLDRIRKEIMMDIIDSWAYSDTDIVFSLDPSWVKYSVPSNKANGNN